MQVSTVTWFLYSPSKKLVFVPIASAVTGIHRDCLVLAPNIQRPEIQSLMSRGQIVSTNLPLWTDRRIDDYNPSVHMGVSVPSLLIESTDIIISIISSLVHAFGWLIACLHTPNKNSILMYMVCSQ